MANTRAPQGHNRIVASGNAEKATDTG
ncbi:hypothetical protein AGR7A_Lc120206 [Agrobacterium deltaense NCPPB 1641]|uniref:Uncharacterized protein n=1 Tax=Agrobacterium deltaense NCPPB 1641 TaxID=1183425 RepID=A0A1S7TVN9_9HYPH|nr:hypothetical protein AGR7A_Lc120206 [Agrobacterium deltaense NCPPB 1641]